MLGIHIGWAQNFSRIGIRRCNCENFCATTRFRAMTWTACSNYGPLAVSPDNMPQSVLSNTALGFVICTQIGNFLTWQKSTRFNFHSEILKSKRKMRKLSHYRIGRNIFKCIDLVCVLAINLRSPQNLCTSLFTALRSPIRLAKETVSFMD